MSHQQVVELWREWWNGDIWIAPLGPALENITPAQAAWKPSPERHSIWQLVQHMIYWRRRNFDHLAGIPRPPQPEIDAAQFAEPESIDQASWDALRTELRETHERITSMLSDGSDEVVGRLRYHLAHDAYHLGQIMYLRALQGLPPVM